MKSFRYVLLIVAAALVAVAAVLAVSGGFRTTVGGFRVSARSPVPAAIAAALITAWWWWLARRDGSTRRDLESWWAAIDRHASRLIGAVALVSAIVAATFATRSAAGADASGYLSEAVLLAHGEQFHAEPLATLLSDVDGWATTPLGWRPARDGKQAPTYPPGLPLLLAIPHELSGIDGAVAVIVASAAVAVWATGLLAGGIAGVIAAVLLAFSPVFLYQSIQVMSDVPVTAAWTAAFLVSARTNRSCEAGGLTALAVLIRPNLAPLALVPFFVVRSRPWFAAPVVIAAALLLGVHRLWYGSPFLSGYGSAAELFTSANIAPNAGRYLQWLIATSPVLLLAPLGIVRLRHDRLTRALGAFAVMVLAAYLIYAVFDHWSYLRFLLPALAVLAICCGIELAAWIARWPAPYRPILLVALLLATSGYGLSVARTLDTFKLAGQLQRVEQVATFIDRNAPADAVLVSGEQSGSMRYHTGRSTVRWEAATPDVFTRSIAAVEAADREMYIVLDAFEDESFRRKFAGIEAGTLDWPAMVEAGTSHRTKVWRIRDRARFLAGDTVDTLRLP